MRFEEGRVRLQLDTPRLAARLCELEDDDLYLAVKPAGGSWGEFHLVPDRHFPGVVLGRGWLCCGGVAPEGASTVTVRNPNGDRWPFPVSDGVWIGLLDPHPGFRPGVSLDPPVCFRDSSGGLVPVPAPTQARVVERLPGTRISCPACSATDWELLEQRETEPAFRCVACGLIRERPLDEED